MSRGHVSAALFDGVTLTREEAAERAFRVNQRRDEAKAARMAARGPVGFMTGAGA